MHNTPSYRLSMGMSFKWGTLDCYSIEKTLGKGSESQVKLAMHKETHQLVALKLLMRTGHDSNSSQDDSLFSNEVNDVYVLDKTAKQPSGIRLPRELSIHQRLQHPHIVTLLEVIQRDDDIVCEVLEYCSKGSLMSVLLDRGYQAFSLFEAHMVFRQLMSGVVYLHSCGISHRDLKPDNLLMNAGNLLKISDFGVSDVFRERDGHLRDLHGIYGTDPYMAPEILNDKSYRGDAIDIWSCGVILLTLILGRPIWTIADTTRDDLFREFCEKGLETFEFEPSLHSLLMSMLHLDPEQRLSAKQILEHEWCSRPCFDTRRYSTKLIPKWQQIKTSSSRKLSNVLRLFSSRKSKHTTNDDAASFLSRELSKGQWTLSSEIDEKQRQHMKRRSFFRL